MSFVVDASFAAAWCFEDEKTGRTEELLEVASQTGFYVPSIWKYEIGNLLRSAERRGRISSKVADDQLVQLAKLVALDDVMEPTQCWQSLMPLARAHVLTVYDAAYIELALRLEVALATRDGAMIAAARMLEIPVLEA